MTSPNSGSRSSSAGAEMDAILEDRLRRLQFDGGNDSTDSQDGDDDASNIFPARTIPHDDDTNVDFTTPMTLTGRLTAAEVVNRTIPRVLTVDGMLESIHEQYLTGDALLFVLAHLHAESDNEAYIEMARRLALRGRYTVSPAGFRKRKSQAIAIWAARTGKTTDEIMEVFLALCVADSGMTPGHTVSHLARPTPSSEYTSPESSEDGTNHRSVGSPDLSPGASPAGREASREAVDLASGGADSDASMEENSTSSREASSDAVMDVPSPTSGDSHSPASFRASSHAVTEAIRPASGDASSPASRGASSPATHGASTEANSDRIGPGIDDAIDSATSRAVSSAINDAIGSTPSRAPTISPPPATWPATSRPRGNTPELAASARAYGAEIAEDALPTIMEDEQQLARASTPSDAGAGGDQGLELEPLFGMDVDLNMDDDAAEDEHELYGGK
ncbi:hypothetical protein K461DRAFT_320559 [Myriangium duriaei CBS 260.36]|uniref:Uncharacterized protein n=1 Tax=Myriangium duriaei CBS 260.36 TaxID=1168546 RepID=A0A9P4J3H8_9PEZI|nr:hypothetical protein K461DRAFT_320559 [Myriangium duriaei CBS 260.36]